MAIIEDRPIPGTIKIFRNESDLTEPTFISLFAQYGMGKPYAYNNQGKDAYPDDATLRQRWFVSCLEQVAKLQPASVALPYKIGCGLAFGNWEVYEKLIDNWAKKNPMIKVVLYSIE